MKKFKAILFDLDGTLLDTLGDLADSANYALEKLGFEPHPLAPYNHFVGNGMWNLIKRALPPGARDGETIDKCLELFRTHYKQVWHCNTKPYEGIVDMLCGLRKKNIQLAILSNKPDDFTKIMVFRFLPDIDFTIIQGALENVPLKPDPSAAIAIADKMNIPADDFLYLGDTDTDMQTAVAAGMYPVGVLWGFRDHDELKDSGALDIIEKPKHLLDLMGLNESE